MIKVTKQGVRPIDTDRDYHATCPICGCEFDYKITDAVIVERSINGGHVVNCPMEFCQAPINQKNNLIVPQPEKGGAQA